MNRETGGKWDVGKYFTEASSVFGLNIPSPLKILVRNELIINQRLY